MTAVFVVASTLASAGLAADAFISGPSIARANTPVLLSGGNFAPNTAVTVMVRSPNGQEAGCGAVANADGTLSDLVTPQSAGARRRARDDLRLAHAAIRTSRPEESACAVRH